MIACAVARMVIGVIVIVVVVFVMGGGSCYHCITITIIS